MNSTMTGDEARALREGGGFTQEQWAVAMGVRARTISRWETSGNIPATAARLMKLIAHMANDNEEETHG